MIKNLMGRFLSTEASWLRWNAAWTGLATSGRDRKEFLYAGFLVAAFEKLETLSERIRYNTRHAFAGYLSDSFRQAVRLRVFWHMMFP